MNAPSPMTDIRVGDLVKATGKTDPDLVITGRVRCMDGYTFDLNPDLSLTLNKYNFEVLDRPLPPIDDELLRGADAAYREGMGYEVPGVIRAAYHPGIKAVINYLREHDTYNKESK